MTFSSYCSELLQGHVEGKLRRVLAPSGIQALDRHIGGLAAGEVCVILARDGVGKSSVALCMCLAQSAAGRSPLYISMEDPESVVAERTLGYLCGVSLARLRSGTLTEQDREKLRSGAGTVAGCTMGVLFMAGRRTQELVEAVRQAAQEGKLGCVVVDYAQELRCGAGSRRDDIMYSIMDLQAAAVHHQVPLVLLSQVTEYVDREGRPPARDEFPSRWQARWCKDIGIKARILVTLRETEQGVQARLDKNTHGCNNLIWSYHRDDNGVLGEVV